MDSLVSSWRSYWTNEAPPPPSPIIPFPPLPPELILHILTLSLPPPSYQSLSTSPSHHGARARRLHQFATLHPDFHSHFTRLSQIDIRLHSLDSAARFLHRGQKEGWAKRVRSLRLGSDEGGMGGQWIGDGAVIGELLRVCPRVQELYVAGLAGLDLRYLEGGKNLRTLYLTETRLTLQHLPSTTPSLSSSSGPPSLLLPHLTHLHLRSTIFSGASLPTLLSPSSLPKLRTLDYLSVHQSLVSQGQGGAAPPTLLGAAGGGGGGGSALTQLTASLSSLSPASHSRNSHPAHPLLSQLHHLALGPHATKTLSPSEVALCTQLRTLDLPLSMGMRDDWDWPGSLRAVRWRAAEWRRAEGKEEEMEGELAQEVLGRSLEWLGEGRASFMGEEGEGGRIRKVILTLPSPSRRSPVLTSPADSSTSSPASVPLPTNTPSQELIHRRPSPSSLYSSTGAPVLQVLVWRGGPWNFDYRGDGEAEGEDEARDGPFDVGLERWREAVGREFGREGREKRQGEGEGLEVFR